MKIKVDKEFLEICNKILSSNRTLEEWAECDISDMFQTENYCGGFESLENEFTFSYYGLGQEYWFQLSLDEIKLIYDGKNTKISVRPPD